MARSSPNERSSVIATPFVPSSDHSWVTAHSDLTFDQTESHGFEPATIQLPKLPFIATTPSSTTFRQIPTSRTNFILFPTPSLSLTPTQTKGENSKLYYSTSRNFLPLTSRLVGHPYTPPPPLQSIETTEYRSKTFQIKACDETSTISSSPHFANSPRYHSYGDKLNYASVSLQDLFTPTRRHLHNSEVHVKVHSKSTNGLFCCENSYSFWDVNSEGEVEIGKESALLTDIDSTASLEKYHFYPVPSHLNLFHTSPDFISASNDLHNTADFVLSSLSPSFTTLSSKTLSGISEKLHGTISDSARLRELSLEFNNSDTYASNRLLKSDINHLNGGFLSESEVNESKVYEKLEPQTSISGNDNYESNILFPEHIFSSQRSSSLTLFVEHPFSEESILSETSCLFDNCQEGKFKASPIELTPVEDFHPAHSQETQVPHLAPAANENYSFSLQSEQNLVNTSGNGDVNLFLKDASQSTPNFASTGDYFVSSALWDRVVLDSTEQATSIKSDITPYDIAMGTTLLMTTASSTTSVASSFTTPVIDIASSSHNVLDNPAQTFSHQQSGPSSHLPQKETSLLPSPTTPMAPTTSLNPVIVNDIPHRQPSIQPTPTTTNVPSQISTASSTLTGPDSKAIVPPSIPDVQVPAILPTQTQSSDLASAFKALQITPLSENSVIPNTFLADYPSTTGPTILTTEDISAAPVASMTTPQPASDAADTTATAQPNSDSGADTNIIIGAACGVLVLALIIVIVAICVYWKRSKKTKPERVKGDDLWVELSTSNPAHHMPLPSLTTCASAHEMSMLVKSDNLFTVNFSFEAQQDGQLTIQKGDTLQLVEKAENGWWRGISIKEGISGWFPSSFVTAKTLASNEDISQPPKTGERPRSAHELQGQGPPVCLVKPQRQISSFQIKRPPEEQKEKEGVNKMSILEYREGLEDVENWVNMASSVSVTSLPTTEKSCGTSTAGFSTAATGHRFRAVYAYKPVCKGELPLREGELVVCKERDRNGWMLGSKPRTGEEGWFPAVYVDEVSSDDESLVNPDIPEVYDVLETNKLHDHAWTGIDHTALYPFESPVTGDLAFDDGDIVTVLQTLANGWWFGVKGEACGWFPGTYVKMVESEDPLTTPAYVGNKATEAGLSNKIDKKDNPGEEKRVTDYRPNRKAPDPPPKPKLSSHQVPTNMSFSQSPSPVLPNTSQEILGQQNRKPVRPAPAPPKRKNSKLSQESREIIQKDKVENKVKKTSLTKTPVKLDVDVDQLLAGLANPSESAPPKTQSVVLINGKKACLREIPLSQIDDRQLNPMVRPSTRSFLPSPPNDAQNYGKPFFRDQYYITPRHSQGLSHTTSNDMASPSVGSSLRTPSTTSLDSVPENNFAPSSPGDVTLVDDSTIKRNSTFSQGAKHQALTPLQSETNRSRSNSPALPTSGHLLHAVQRFRDSTRENSPSSSVHSDRGSVRSSELLDDDEDNLSVISASRNRRKGGRNRTLTTVPPPMIPMSHLLQNQRTNSRKNPTDKYGKHTTPNYSTPTAHINGSETRVNESTKEEISTSPGNGNMSHEHVEANDTNGDLGNELSKAIMNEINNRSLLSSTVTNHDVQFKHPHLQHEDRTTVTENPQNSSSEKNILNGRKNDVRKSHESEDNSNLITVQNTNENVVTNPNLLNPEHKTNVESSSNSKSRSLTDSDKLPEEQPRRPSNSPRPPQLEDTPIPARDSLVVVPGKVSEMVQQINSNNTPSPTSSNPSSTSVSRKSSRAGYPINDIHQLNDTHDSPVPEEESFS